MQSFILKGSPLIASGAPFADNAGTGVQRGEEECWEG
jgi:hypothetical protein